MVPARWPVLVTFLMAAVGWRRAFFVVADLALVTVLPICLTAGANQGPGTYSM